MNGLTSSRTAPSLSNGASKLQSHAPAANASHPTEHQAIAADSAKHSKLVAAPQLLMPGCDDISTILHAHTTALSNAIGGLTKQISSNMDGIENQIAEQRFHAQAASATLRQLALDVHTTKQEVSYLKDDIQEIKTLLQTILRGG